MSGQSIVGLRWWCAFVLAAGVSGCVSELSEVDAESVEPFEVGVASQALFSCTSVRASRNEHIRQQRARSVSGRVLAFGSNQPLTSSLAVTLSQTSPGYYVVGPCPAPLSFRFPLNGVASRDWTIGYYRNLAADGSTLIDYRGGTRTKYDVGGGPHNGVDIGIANFRRMDAGVDVFAAESGVVLGSDGTQPDDNTACQGDPNYVKIRHRTGVSTLYLHLRAGSVAVSAGDTVTKGQRIGQVGSSGCSFWPHLHFEVSEFDDTIICPFLDKMWDTMPAYDSPLDLMDFALVHGDPGVAPNSFAAPSANIARIFQGGVFNTVVYTGGGFTGEQVHVDVFNSGNPEPLGTFTRTSTTGETNVIWTWPVTLPAGEYTVRPRIGNTPKTAFPLKVGLGGIVYQGHFEGGGWERSGHFNGAMLGFEGAGIDIEAFAMGLDRTRAAGVCYSVNLENLGWQPEVCGPAVAGMPNSGRAIEAIRVRLNGAPAGCRVRYQTLTRGTGVWSDYAFDNAPSGSGAVDALRVELTEDCVP